MRVLFIDSVHPILEEKLAAAGFICVEGTRLESSNLLEELKQANGVIIRSKFKFTKEVFEKAPALKFIARSGSGLENIDLTAAEKHGVTVFNSPEGNRDAVAEHAMALLLGLFNHLVRGHQEVQKAQWNREKNRGLELLSKTVGIIGYGVMGKAFAQRLSGFGCKVIAHDKYKTGFGDNWAEEVSLKQLQQQADVISLHLPLTDETHYYFDQAFIQQLSKPIYLINTGRGQNVKTDDLVVALDNGSVLGAGLDVLEYESVSFMNLNKEELPETFNQLVKMENVLLSPHVAGWTVESYIKLSTFLADKILNQFKPKT